MHLQQRINLLAALGNYLQNGDDEFELVKERAYQQNQWFVPEFINMAVENICTGFLQIHKLSAWANSYKIMDNIPFAKTVGIVMAGNIPLVGFHDMLCVFISGHKAVIKVSSKDAVLIKHIVHKMCEWEGETSQLISFEEMLKGCDAFIATGSNNSGRYFEYYFGKYPSLIRTNKTSVALLEGNETKEELDRLADDIQLYFGLGCRNVTKLYAPHGYDFIDLLSALKKYDYFMNFNKYHNNYDYQLALLLMNSKYYMTNGSVILAENESIFAPVSQLNYEFYSSMEILQEALKNNTGIQCITGNNNTGFGEAQHPGLTDYADRRDTLAFLCSL